MTTDIVNYHYAQSKAGIIFAITNAYTKDILRSFSAEINYPEKCEWCNTYMNSGGNSIPNNAWYPLGTTKEIYSQLS